MIIDKVYIHKFRSFENLEIPLGEKITVIAGQNGTQKTTLLGIIGQTFSMEDPNNPFCSEKTIDGYKFTSKLNDKFKFSPNHDIAGEHRWDLYISNKEIYDKGIYPVKSIYRNDPKRQKELRFWHATDKSRGSGYIQLPVIYLSLKRLSPIGEEKNIRKNDVVLSIEDNEFYRKYHKNILLIKDEIITSEHIKSFNKSSLGAKTEFYDAETNSAGQDSLGKILMAILSFKHLKEKFPSDYKGGLLTIDELDATFFPAAQEKLISALYRFASDYNLQIVFTTHSLSVIRVALDNKYKNDTQIIYLSKIGVKIKRIPNPTLQEIQHDLDVTVNSNAKQRIRAYCEDDEARYFAKALMGRKYTKLLEFIPIKIGGDNLLDLLKRHIPDFDNSLIILDSDKKNRGYKNLIILPGENISPEIMIYRYLNALNQEDHFWENSLDGYTWQKCFKNFTEEPSERKQAKLWFNEQKANWGKECSKLFTHWKSNNNNEVEKFLCNFIKAYNYLAERNKIEEIKND
ncbi:MAG: ATP-dependent nuclease [Candidatus Humimicrobiaceae bacterium]